ncbi:MAG TPA: hypothetical protein VJ931_11680, partial [Actinomycetota bacterium]|nr:hypothetical protein [Actinomycetota bacterium]
MAIGALLRLLASVPEVRRTDIGLSTDPMRSITDSGPGDRSSGGVRPCCPSLLRSPPIQEIKRIVGEAHDEALDEPQVYLAAGLEPPADAA